MLVMKGSNASKSSGFTLIEVLISMVILAIGLLGLAGLQTVALRQNSSSQMTSQAMDLINEMADRMRANRAGTDADNYTENPAPVAPAWDCITNFGGTVTGTECNPQEIAQLDLSSWQTAITRVFPNGAGVIGCVDNTDPGFPGVDTDGVCTVGSMFDLTVSWDEATSDLIDPVQTYTVTIQP